MKEDWKMYQIIVDEWKNPEKGSGQILPFRGRKPLAVENCRISALSSADFCLGQRTEMARGKFAWTGSGQQVRRLFAAERLNDRGLKCLDNGKQYSVLFQGSFPGSCA